MYFLQRVEFISLLGLLVQALVAWALVAAFASVRRRSTTAPAFESFFFAFLALACALTVISVRFCISFELARTDPIWRDGHWPSRASYAAYQALKGAFGLLLVRGCYSLAQREPPAPARWMWAPAMALLVLPALWIDPVTPLLAMQAPVMVACAVTALRVLSSSPLEQGTTRLVKGSLIALAASWVAHGALAAASVTRPQLNDVLAFASFVDLAVQILLGAGLITIALHEDHRRLRAAEQQREELQRRIDRDDRLRALGTLVSGVAHELNNPLTVILGYAEVIASGARADAASRVVIEQAERCRGIVRSLSALVGPAVNARKEIQCTELVQRVLRGLAPELAARACIQCGDMHGIRLHVDQVGMEQVLTNLVVNALHVSPQGGTIAIDAHSSAAGVEFSITDQGPGVPIEVRPRLFEPFFTTKGPGKGTGLGLSIAYAVVRGHGGTILVDDNPAGRGARFRVLIPPSTEPPSPRREVAPERAHAGSLLVIDDDAAVRSVVRLQAERRGWTVFEASSAEAALGDRERLARCAAALCDLRMPGLGGIGLHDRLERDDPAALARFVFVTGDLASAETLRFSKRTARPLLEKPFDFDELFDNLNRVAPALTASR